MNNTKILAVDLDDTLLSDDKTICEENIKALNEMLDKGHILCVDTGRPAHIIANLLSDYPVFSRKNVYFLGYQGSTGYDAYEKKDLFGTYLDNAAAVSLVEEIMAAGLSAIVFEEGHIMAFGADENVEGYGRLAKEPVEILSDVSVIKGHNLIKIMSINFSNPEALHKFEDEHFQETSKYFNSMFSQVSFLEYVSKEASKGDGLIKLAKYLNIPVENTVACGDERNDISMVTMAGVGCAVINAREELKAQADYVTTVNNNDGAVAEVVNKFILN